ncbi:MAG: TetR/AcrR family transcriptional regulator [Erysipelotrichaceae bacterium]|nr:TetR/AcrR family transcriptional regulator [Erysipelotrichaceae bacterium]
MDAAGRKMKMMDAAMKTIAEKGLESFSVAQAAVRANINEALVYRDFGTKENLLCECFAQVNHEMLDAFKYEEKLKTKDESSVLARAHSHWMILFAKFIESDYKTLFYQQYRDSSYKMREAEKQKIKQYDVKTIFAQSFVQFLKDPNDIDYVSAFIIDGMVFFAKMIICKELPNTEETYEKIWELMNGGLQGLTKKII